MPAEMVIINERFVATPELQFEERPSVEPPYRMLRILQQRWVMVGTQWGVDLDDTNSEWRDVPCVKGV